MRVFSNNPFCLVFVVLLVMRSSAMASYDITGNDIVPIPAGVTGSGNGTLDLRMMTFSGSEIQNDAGAFNGDNGNNALPQGGGSVTWSFEESYATTAGKLQEFYDLNFGPGNVNEVVLFLDLNETGDGQAVNTLGKLDIVLNPATVNGSPPIPGLSSSQQANIDQIYTGGSTIANLNPQPAKNLPVNAQGAGFADYAIRTGIDPFSLNASDILLFNISMSMLNNGAEEWFLSGTFSGSDIPVIPEPSTFIVWSLLGGLGIIGWWRRRR
jgi:hypothetical protein